MLRDADMSTLSGELACSINMHSVVYLSDAARTACQSDERPKQSDNCQSKMMKESENEMFSYSCEQRTWS